MKYLDEDTTVLTLVDNVWQTVQNARYGTFNKLLRRNEEQDFDHDNFQVYIQDYATLGNDNLNTNTTTQTLTPNINSVTLAAPSLDGIGAMGIGSTFIID